jgi:hypothetical protein
MEIRVARCTTKGLQSAGTTTMIRFPNGRFPSNLDHIGGVMAAWAKRGCLIKFLHETQ